MSGGEYNYAFRYLDDFAENVIEPNNVWDMGIDRTEPKDFLKLRTRFANHCKEVAKAMHATEWYDSGDTGEEDFLRAMDEFFSSLKKA